MGYGLVSRLEEPSTAYNLGVRSSLAACVLSYPLIAAFNAIGPQTLGQSFTNKQTLIAAALVIPAKMVYNRFLREPEDDLSSRVIPAIKTGIFLGLPLLLVNNLNSQAGMEHPWLKTAAEMGAIGTAKFLYDARIKPAYDYVFGKLLGWR